MKGSDGQHRIGSASIVPIDSDNSAYSHWLSSWALNGTDRCAESDFIGSARGCAFLDANDGQLGEALKQ